MKNEDPKITAVETVGEMEDVGAVACKAMPPGRRYRYKQETKYTLEDGRFINSCVTGETKPKLAKSFERTKQYISEGAIFALFRDDKFVGTKTCVCIGIGPKQSVVCDLCNEDFTNSKETGGVYGWSTKAICPRCAPAFLKSAEQHGEMNMLKARCPEGKAFADWVREDLR